MWTLPDTVAHGNALHSITAQHGTKQRECAGREWCGEDIQGMKGVAHCLVAFGVTATAMQVSGANEPAKAQTPVITRRDNLVPLQRMMG